MSERTEAIEKALREISDEAKEIAKAARDRSDLIESAVDTEWILSVSEPALAMPEEETGSGLRRAAEKAIHQMLNEGNFLNLKKAGSGEKLVKAAVELRAALEKEAGG